MDKLRKEIEATRKKLDDAIKKGYNEQTCYKLSIELDRLIEIYIDVEERERIPMV